MKKRQWTSEQKLQIVMQGYPWQIGFRYLQRVPNRTITVLFVARPVSTKRGQDF